MTESSPMNNLEDTLVDDILTIAHDEPSETTLIALDDSLPDLPLPSAVPDRPGAPVNSSCGFLLTLLRALSAWNV
jgi:hypothetical protein